MGFFDGMFGLMAQDSANFTEKDLAQNGLYYQFDQLDKITGGAASNYALNYAFRSPSEQGAMARAKAEAMFPELSPWELSGTPASGVSAAVGGEATSATQDATKVASQNALQAAGIQSQIQMNKMNIVGNLVSDAVKGAVQTYNNKVTNETNIQTNENTVGLGRDQLEQLKKFQGVQADKIVSDISRNNNLNNLTDAQAANQVAQLYTEQLKQQGITLTNEQIPKMTSLIEARIQQARTGNSTVGKTATDISNAMTGAIDEVNTMLKNYGVDFGGIKNDISTSVNNVSSSVGDSIEDAVKGVKDGIASAFGIGQGRTVKSKNNSRTYHNDYMRKLGIAEEDKLAR